MRRLTGSSPPALNRLQIEDGKVSTMLRQLGRTLQHAIQDGTILGRIG